MLSAYFVVYWYITYVCTVESVPWSLIVYSFCTVSLCSIWAQKRISLRYISVSGGPCNIFFLFTYCSFSLLIVIIAGRPLKLAILIAPLVTQSIICLLVFFSNIILFHPCINFIHVCKLQKNIELCLICTACSHSI